MLRALSAREHRVYTAVSLDSGRRREDALSESRVRFKPKSRFALGHELKAKGIDASLAQPILDQYCDLDLALRAVKPRIQPWHGLDPETRKNKLMNFLRYRGFDYGVCIAVWEKMFPSE